MTEGIVEDFLHKIGFTDDDIHEFFEENTGKGSDDDWDDFDDFWDIDLLEDEEFVDLFDDGKLIEEYWEKGWISGFCHFRRFNFDSFGDKYRKVFPTRYRLKDFKFTKSLRRILKKNSDLKTIIRPLRITPEKSDLYDKYHLARHGNSYNGVLLNNYQYIKNFPTELMEVCIYNDRKLVACSIFEVGNYALYSRSAFWDLDEKARGLGILTVLLEIQYGLKRELKYYYLGHLCIHNPNYHYKTRFGGLELYEWESECWIDFKDPKTKELLKQKLPRRTD